MSAPSLAECGFFGPGTTVSEAELRATLSSLAIAERENWFDSAGHAIDEQADTQFGHLVRYWLASKSGILPTTLTFIQARAIAPSFAWGPLLSAGASNAEIAAARGALLVGAPDVGSPLDLTTLVQDALRGAYESGQGNPDFPWSSVFVVSCVRGAAIELGLEAISGGSHVGRDELLLATEGHRFYVQEAYKRRFGPGLKDGTYQASCPAHASCPEHASCPDERPVQVGDIIVQDRTKNIDGVANVDNFCDIRDEAFLDPNPLHGDIVVEVDSSSATAIGGNLQSGIDSAMPSVFAVRRRRFPLNSDGTLAVAGEKLFTQEDDAGNLPWFPADDPSTEVNSKSTGRIFALLSPVERCVPPPGVV
jgi:hypothetical protein